MLSIDSGLSKLRDAARRRERDFMSLFNALWYRDFPFIRDHEPHAVRAMFTAHINSVVKACADLMGFFTLFEESNRTDIVIQKSSRNNWAKLEIEWKQPIRESMNEIRKLAESSARDEADVFVVVTYSDNRKIEDNKNIILKQWSHESAILIVFMLTYDQSGRRRKLTTLQTYRIKSGHIRKVREQYALPWDVPDSRWQAAAER